MSIDIFGRQLASGGIRGGVRGPPGIGFNITAGGQYDMNNKRLCNIADPQDSGDAVSLKFVSILVLELLQPIESKINDNARLQEVNIEKLSKHVTQTSELIKNLESEVASLKISVKSLIAWRAKSMMRNYSHPSV